MILVTGGSGMVGSELRKILPNAMYPTSSELNLLDQNSIETYFRKHKIDSVIHLAAYVGSLHDNIENAVRYYEQNVLMNTQLTKSAYANGVQRFIGILSTCIYPNDGLAYPMKEDDIHNGAPHESLYSYAYAKRSHAVQLNAYKSQYGVNYSYLIPTNMYGQSLHLDRMHFINDLVVKIIRATKNGEKELRLFGDGSPLRQFIAAKDFALFIKLYLESGCGESLNVSDEYNRSINEMARLAVSLYNPDLHIVYDSSKPNGQYRKDVDVSRLKQIFPQFSFNSLENGLLELFEYYEKIL